MRRALVTALLLAAAACGGARKDAKEPERASSEGGGAPADADHDMAPAESAPATAGARPAAEAPSEDAREMMEIRASDEQIALAADDCVAACRALTSMDRAAGRLCKLVDQDGRCAKAKETVYSARARVKKTCRSCPETSVEAKDAVPFER